MKNDDFPERAAQAIAQTGSDARSVSILESQVVPILDKIERNTRRAEAQAGIAVAVATRATRDQASAASRVKREKTAKAPSAQSGAVRAQAQVQAVATAQAVGKAVSGAVEKAVAGTIQAQVKAAAKVQAQQTVKAAQQATREAVARQKRLDRNTATSTKSAQAIETRRATPAQSGRGLNLFDRAKGIGSLALSLGRKARGNDEVNDTAGRATAGPIWGAIQELSELREGMGEKFSDYKDWRDSKRQGKGPKGSGRDATGRFATARASGPGAGGGGILDSVLGVAGDWIGGKAKGVAGGVAGRMAARGGILGKFGSMAGGLLGTGAVPTVAATAGGIAGGGMGILGKLGSKLPLVGGLLAGGAELLSSGSVGKAVGAGGGAMGGAAAGAAMGTMVMPGVGTAIGGLIGGILGEVGGKEIGGLIESIGTLDKTVKDSDKNREEETQKMGGFLSAMGNAWGAVKGAASNVVDGVQEAVGTAWDTGTGAVKGVASAVAQGLGFGDSKDAASKVPNATSEGWKGTRDTIVGASKATGADAGTMAAIAQIESGFKPNARAKTSSAGGLYQFTDSTWASMLKTKGAQYGLDANTSKYDPRANALMGGEYIKQNQQTLSRNLGREATPTDTYVGHFLGTGGATKFLQGMQANPNASAASLVGAKAAQANSSIFYEKGTGRERSAKEVYDLMGAKLEKASAATNEARAMAANQGQPQEPTAIPTAVSTTPRKDNTLLAQAAAGTPKSEAPASQASRADRAARVQELKARVSGGTATTEERQEFANAVAQARGGTAEKITPSAPVVASRQEPQAQVAQARQDASRASGTRSIMPTPTAMASSKSSMADGLRQNVLKAEAAGDAAAVEKWRAFAASKGIDPNAPPTAQAQAYEPASPGAQAAPAPGRSGARRASAPQATGLTQEDQDREELRGRAAGMREAMAKNDRLMAASDAKDTVLTAKASAWRNPNDLPEDSVQASSPVAPLQAQGTTSRTASIRGGLSQAIGVAQGIPQMAGLKMPELASTVQSQASALMGPSGGSGIPGMDALMGQLSKMTEAFGRSDTERQKDTESQDTPNIPFEFDDTLLMLMAYDKA